MGGIEAEAVMLGQTISMVLPKVVGYKLSGSIGKWTTSTDVVLTITKVIGLVVVLKQTSNIRSIYLIDINFVAYFIHKNYTYITLK